ncbi:VOC family protein [Streptomyces sp. MN3]
MIEPRGIHRDTGPPAAVVIDCADPRAMAALWGEALDRTVHEVTDAYASLRSPRPRALPGVPPHPDSDTEPDRLRLCLRLHLRLCLCLCLPADDPAAEVARLRALRATPVGARQGEPSGPVLTGPEGHAFRVVTSGRSS